MQRTPYYIHFLIQSLPTLSVNQMGLTIKSITAREIAYKLPEVKKDLWGGNFWTNGYYAKTVGHYSNAEVLKKYVENQSKQYSQLQTLQLNLR